MGTGLVELPKLLSLTDPAGAVGEVDLGLEGMTRLSIDDATLEAPERDELAEAPDDEGLKAFGRDPVLY
jgi:hypothetical protein